MSEFNVEVAGGSSVRLKTAGKYCDRDILVTATGGSAVLRDIVIPATITTYVDTIQSKPNGYETGNYEGLIVPALQSGDVITFSNDIVIPDTLENFFLSEYSSHRVQVKHDCFEFGSNGGTDKENFTLHAVWGGKEYWYISSLEVAMELMGATSIEQLETIGVTDKGWYHVDMAAGVITRETPTVIYLAEYEDSKATYGVPFIIACAVLLDLAPFDGFGKVSVYVETT